MIATSQNNVYHMTKALKEWAVTCSALGTGDQTVSFLVGSLLRLVNITPHKSPTSLIHIVSMGQHII